METRADGDHGERLSPPVGPLDILPECVFQFLLNLITFFCLRAFILIELRFLSLSSVNARVTSGFAGNHGSELCALHS